MNWYIIIVVFVWVVLTCVGILALFGTYILVRRMLQWLQEEKKNGATQPTPKQGGMSKNQPVEWSIVRILTIVLVAAAVFIGGAIAAKYLWGFEVENSDIVLTFVGVLATFIVVTNYAQVLEIKKEVNNRISSIEGWKSRMSDRITHPDKYVKDEHISSISQKSRIRSVRPKHKE